MQVGNRLAGAGLLIGIKLWRLPIFPVIPDRQANELKSGLPTGNSILQNPGRTINELCSSETHPFLGLRCAPSNGVGR